MKKAGPHFFLILIHLSVEVQTWEVEPEEIPRLMSYGTSENYLERFPGKIKFN